MQKYNVFTIAFNPSVGDKECFLCSVYARNRTDAKAQAREHMEPGETPIVRIACESKPHHKLSQYA